MKPAWSPILLTTLIGAGQGLFLAMAWVAFLGPAPAVFFAGGSVLALALLGAGIAVAGRRIRWRSVLVPLNFALLGTASGFTLAVPLAVLAHPRFAGPLALAAFSISAAAWLVRGLSLIGEARRLQGDRVLRAARWAFVVLVFPAPGWLLGWGGGTLTAYAAAFALQFAGLLAERWSYFAAAPPGRSLV